MIQGFHFRDQLITTLIDMLHAYNELYLDKARTSMAMMLDFAVRELRMDAGTFFDLFISSGMADLFGHGDVRTIAGMSGVELACQVLALSGIPAERTGYRYTSGRSREYWTGWALAGYQWERSLPFADIISAVPVRDIIAMCDDYRGSEIKLLSEGLSWMDTVRVPDHMSDENYSEFRSRLDALISDSSSGTKLKRIRMRCGMSQSMLAASSGVPVRTIQQYEQRQKDINKASFESIVKLAAALGCESDDLLERSVLIDIE